MTFPSTGERFRVSLRVVLPATLAVLLGAPGWTGTALARFVCLTNVDCADLAAQCDPGRIPCNDGICDPASPDADNTGCVLIPNDSKCDDGLFCNGAATCSSEHGCNDPVLPDCDDGVACTEDACDELADQCTHLKRNSRCNNGLFCDGKETCDPTLGCVAGTPPKCGDVVDCTTDTCDEANNTCAHTVNDAACSNGLICDGVEICSPTLGCQPGTPPNCNNGQFCDGVETCDPALGCVAGTPPNCGDNVVCTADSCIEATDTCAHVVSNAACSNGLFCDGSETCDPTLGCRPGTPPNCNDKVACTADTCDEANDICAHVVNNASCSNGVFCDGAEVCNPTLGCRPGPATTCNDNIDCTTDRCVEANDTCTHAPVNSVCINDKFCDGVETCSPTLGCQAGTPPNCMDNVACTEDRCVEATDSCAHVEFDAACNNGLFCDGVERCEELLGCYAGAAPSCSDNVDCTVDACIEATDSCSHTASNALCNDGLFCDGVEICSPLLGCQPGTAPDCDDDITCTLDSCSEVAHECVNTPKNTPCNNGQFCDGTEQCDPLIGCVPGTPPNCADALTCTDDTCIEATDMCLHDPNGALCGNGVVDPGCGEECDEDEGEICNNLLDDDLDTLIDCQDPDCSGALLPTCDDMCRLVPPCRPLLRDPAVISFGGAEDDEFRAAGESGTFSFHGSLIPSTPIDPLAERFVVTLGNANGEIYRAELKPVDVKADGSRFRFRAEDLGAVVRDGGIARLSIRRRLYQGEMGYGIRVRAYGDFSRATLATMTTQVYFGDDVGYVTATWSGKPGQWVLRQRDLDDGQP